MSVVARKPKSQQAPEAKRRAAISKPMLQSQRQPRINARSKLDCASFSGFG